MVQLLIDNVSALYIPPPIPPLQELLLIVQLFKDETDIPPYPALDALLKPAPRIKLPPFIMLLLIVELLMVILPSLKTPPPSLVPDVVA